MHLRNMRAAVLICGLCLGLAACKSAEERAEDYFESAQTLIAAGDQDRALVELRNVLELVPTHVEARRSTARLMMERGNYSNAFAQYTHLIELRPDDAEARIALAELSFEARDWEVFDHHAPRAIELDTGDARAQAIEIALAYRTATLEKDVPATEAASLRAEEMAASLPDGSSLLEQILFDTYMRADNAKAALEQLDLLIARRPDLRSQYDQRLLILINIADPAEIEAHLRRVVEIFPDDTEAKHAMVQYFVASKEIDKAEAFLREIGTPTDPDPSYYLTLIQFLWEVRGSTAARAELDAGIEVSSEPDRLRMIRASLDFSEGQQEAAIADLQTVLDRRTAAEATPGDLDNEIRVTLSRMLQSTGDEAGAQQLVAQVLADDADNVEALKISAVRLIDADETDAAIANLRRALDSAPQDVATLNLMADAYLRAGSRDLAQDYIAQAVDVSGQAPGPSLRYAGFLNEDDNLAAAEEVLLAALRRAPDNEDILLSLGDIYINTENLSRAEAIAGQLRGLGTERAETVANGIQTWLLAQRKGNAEALTFLEQMATSSEAGFAEKTALLRARLAAGQSEEALKLAEALAAEAPEDPDRRFLLAMTRANTGDLATAHSDLQALAAADPTREEVWLQLYRIAAFDAGPEDASAVLTEALEALPTSTTLQWARATELEKAGEIDAAIAIYEELYLRDTNAVTIANNLASLLVTYRDDDASLDQAWAIARRLRDTEIPAFQDTYGWLAFRRGDPETALPYLEAAAAGMPQDPIVQLHLAQTYAALNRPREAIIIYTLVLEIAGAEDTRPQIASAREALARLRESTSEAANQ